MAIATINPQLFGVDGMREINRLGRLVAHVGIFGRKIISHPDRRCRRQQNHAENYPAWQLISPFWKNIRHSTLDSREGKPPRTKPSARGEPSSFNISNPVSVLIRKSFNPPAVISTGPVLTRQANATVFHSVSDFKILPISYHRFPLLAPQKRKLVPACSTETNAVFGAASAHLRSVHRCRTRQSGVLFTKPTHHRQCKV